MEEFQGNWDGFHRFKRQPDQAGDEVDELESGFPFPQIVGSEDMSGFDGDLAEAGDEEFAADDEGGDPDRADTFCGQENEGGADEDFIGEGIEELSERGDEVHFPRQPAIDEVADGGYDEENQGSDVAPCAFPCHEDNERRGEDEA